VPDSS